MLFAHQVQTSPKAAVNSLASPLQSRGDPKLKVNRIFLSLLMPEAAKYWHYSKKTQMASILFCQEYFTLQGKRREFKITSFLSFDEMKTKGV